MADADGAPIDRYVVLEHLSEGGMGAIYVGKKMGAAGFEMEVVLKQLLPEFTQQTEFIDLFLREAKLSATLDHANIIHTIDLVTAGGEYFIVMEYLAGADLRTMLKKAKRRGNRLSPAAAIFIAREVLSALAYAHVKRDFDGKSLDLIHRDVSPSNILVSYNGEVKLTDFGIAKASTHHSLFYKVKGKIGYMSPEQAKSEALDHRSDLYSLAVVLYETLTGERLFVHAGLTTSADVIYAQPVPLVSRKVPGLTPDMDAIMKKALAIDPAARYQTAGEFQEALMRCAHRNGLLMSASELAADLVTRCGPVAIWREDDDDDELDFAPRAGTEVYNPADDDDDDDGEVIAAAAALRSSAPRVRARTEMSMMQPIEMASLIEFNDLEEASKIVDLASLKPVSATPAASAGLVVPTRSLRPSAPPNIGIPAGPLAMPPPPVAPPPRTKSPSVSPLVPAIAATAATHGTLPVLEPPPGSPLARAAASRTKGASQAPLSAQDAKAIALKIPVEPPADAAHAAHAADAAAIAAPPAAELEGARRGFIQPWMVIVLILLIAGGIAVLVGMSGPDLPQQ